MSRGRHGAWLRAPAMECSIWGSAGVVVTIAAALSLSGCDVPRVEGYVEVGDMHIAGHAVPFWRTKQDYFEKFSYMTTPGEVENFNSCMDPSVNSLEVCNGRGRCMPFNPRDPQHPIFFCDCDKDWGGPECKGRRKRQSTAWMLSLIGGPLGIDEIYLGWTLVAAIKIVCTGVAAASAGVGAKHIGVTFLLCPWLLDVVRIGSAPVRADEYRVNNDLPNWAFAVFTILHFCFIAVILGVIEVYYTVTHKRFVADYWKYYGS